MKEVNITVKKSSHKSSKNKVKKKIPSGTRRLIVGEDEFCPTCMEWREFDEVTGKCKICGRQIKKTDICSRAIHEEYDLKDFTNEPDEQSDVTEY